jgi:DnaK suppressor protein
LNLTDLRQHLTRLRKELESIAETGAESSQVVELDQAKVGRLTRMDAMQAQAMAQATGQRREQMLRKIEAALSRIDNNDFGVCRVCAEPIPIQRLKIDPTATRCVDCASEAES